MFAHIFTCMIVACAAHVLTVPRHRPLMRSEPVSLIDDDSGNGKRVTKPVTPQEVDMAKDDKEVGILKDDKIKSKKPLEVKNASSTQPKAAHNDAQTPTTDAKHAAASSKSTSTSSSSSSSSKSSSKTAPKPAAPATTAPTSTALKGAMTAAKDSEKATAGLANGSKRTSGVEAKEAPVKASIASKNQGATEKQSVGKGPAGDFFKVEVKQSKPSVNAKPAAAKTTHARAANKYTKPRKIEPPDGDLAVR